VPDTVKGYGKVAKKLTEHCLYFLVRDKYGDIFQLPVVDLQLNGQKGTQIDTGKTGECFP
jgi:hypothetical protein